MNHAPTLPLPSVQRMSLVPSPLKSPVWAIVQLSGTLPITLVDAIWLPFISQSTKSLRSSPLRGVRSR